MYIANSEMLNRQFKTFVFHVRTCTSYTQYDSALRDPVLARMHCML